MRIRVSLLTPLAFWGSKKQNPLMFDGILGYVAMMRLGYRKTPAEHLPETLVLPPLPIRKERAPEGEFYRASAMFVPKGAYWTQTMLVKQADWGMEAARTFKKYAGRTLEEQSGPYRQCLEPYMLLVTPYVDFYCDCENESEMYSLLKDLRSLGFIGSKRAAGYGMIASISVDPSDPGEWGVWKDGRPTRPVPVGWAGENLDCPVEWCRLTPPYWHHHDRKLCYVPHPDQWSPPADPVARAKELEEEMERLRRAAEEQEKLQDNGVVDR